MARSKKRVKKSEMKNKKKIIQKPAISNFKLKNEGDMNYYRIIIVPETPYEESDLKLISNYFDVFNDTSELEKEITDKNLKIYLGIQTEGRFRTMSGSSGGDIDEEMMKLMNENIVNNIIDRNGGVITDDIFDEFNEKNNLDPLDYRFQIQQWKNGIAEDDIFSLENMSNMTQFLIHENKGKKKATLLYDEVFEKRYNTNEYPNLVKKFAIIVYDETP